MKICDFYVSFICCQYVAAFVILLFQRDSAQLDNVNIILN